MARIGDYIQAGLNQYDPSPYLAAQSNATRTIGAGISDAIGNFGDALDDRKKKKDTIKVSSELLDAYAKLNPQAAGPLGGYLEKLKDEEIPLSERAALGDQIGALIGMDQERQKTDRQVSQWAQNYALDQQQANLNTESGRFELDAAKEDRGTAKQAIADSAEVRGMVAPGLLEQAVSIAKSMEANGGRPPISSAQLQEALQTGTTETKMRTAEAFTALLPKEQRPEFVDVQFTENGQPATGKAVWDANTGQFVLPGIRKAGENHDNASGVFRVPTTNYSLGAAAGGPDEIQDKWTNKGYSSSGKNLTPGVVAVNEKAYKLGTVFQDADTGETFIAADRHGNKDPNVIDFYQDPKDYKQSKGARNLRVIGFEENIGKTPQEVQAQLQKWTNTSITPGAAKSTVTPKTPAEIQKEQLEIKKLQGDVDAKAQDLTKQEDMKATALSNAKDAIALIDAIPQHPGFNEAVGSGFYRSLGALPFVPNDWTPAGSDKAGSMAQIDKLQAGAFLTAIQQLRGLGALSDAEGKKLEAATANLNRIQGEEDFKAALKDYRATINSAIQRLGGEAIKSADEMTAAEKLRKKKAEQGR